MDKDQQAKLEYYVGLDYPVNLSRRGEGQYIAWSPQWHVCARGETEHEALAMFEREQRAMFERSINLGLSISYPAQVITDASGEGLLTLLIAHGEVFFIGEPYEPGYIKVDAIPDIITALQTIQREIKEGKHD